MSDIAWTVPEVLYVKQDGNDTTGDGLAMSTAYKTLTKATDKTSKAAGTVILVARDVLQTLAANKTSVQDAGRTYAPIMILAWPRPAIAALTGDFTNGSTTVGDISGLTIVELDHAGRYITAPDGETYKIAKRIDDTSFYLSRKYRGTTVNNGSFSIIKDKYYDWAQSLTAGDGADDKATWDAMTKAPPQITASGAYYYLFNQTNWRIVGMRFTNGGAVYLLSMSSTTSGTNDLVDCYFDAAHASSGSCVSGFTIKVDGCIFNGTGGAATISAITNLISGIFYDCVVYDCATLITTGGYNEFVRWYNSSLGVLAPTRALSAVTGAAYDYCNLKFINCSFPSVIYATAINRSLVFTPSITFENCDGISDRRQIPKVGSVIKNTGSGVTLPTGADHVVECIIDGTSYIYGRRNENDTTNDFGQAPLCVEWRIWQTALTQKTYKVYVQSTGGNLLSYQMWMQIEYPGNASGDISIVKSTDGISERSDNDDWSQYLLGQTTNAVAGWVTIRIFLAIYHASYLRFISPLLEIDGVNTLVTPRYSYGDSMLNGVLTPCSAGGSGTKSRSGNILGIKRGSY